MIDDKKPLLASKTFWFNLVLMAAFLTNRYGEQMIEPEMFEPIAVLLALTGNTILRLITNTGIKGIK